MIGCLLEDMGVSSHISENRIILFSLKMKNMKDFFFFKNKKFCIVEFHLDKDKYISIFFSSRQFRFIGY